jgi:uncharacterized protein YbjT (DUF2867 family)
MLIAVVGGTGAAGRAAVAEARRRGHTVRVVSRHPGPAAPDGTGFAAADLTTGAGLREAMRGAEVVINCSNSGAASGAALRAYFTDGTRRLAEAAAAAGVRRHVLLSIVGIEQVPMPYYRAKVAQEAVAKQSAVPVSVVRATQFHEFAGQLMRRFGIGPFALVPRMRVQSVDTAEVGRVLLDAAESPKLVSLWQIAGPREESLADLARRIARAEGVRRIVIPAPLAPGAARAIRAGALLLPGGPAGGRDFGAWLASTHAPASRGGAGGGGREG